MQRHLNVILICTLCAFTAAEVKAQTTLRTGVFATGGGMLSNGTYAAAGTMGQSVIGRSVGTTFAASAGFWGDGGVILEVEEPATIEVPAEYALMQNYPNPFNPMTTIRYGLPRKSTPTLAIFNALGQQVALLVDGEQEAGYHDVKFDASGFASGVYFYRLVAGDFVQTRKLLLLR
jgi:hypothetical protein